MLHKPDPFVVIMEGHEDDSAPNNVTDAPPPLRLPVPQPIPDWTDLLPPSEHVVFLKSIDWGKTHVGPMQSWSLALRQTVYSILAEVHPANVYWYFRHDFVTLYNAKRAVGVHI